MRITISVDVIIDVGIECLSVEKSSHNEINIIEFVIFILNLYC